jgi:hypothetical protein
MIVLSRQKDLVEAQRNQSVCRLAGSYKDAVHVYCVLFEIMLTRGSRAIGLKIRATTCNIIYSISY